MMTTALLLACASLCVFTASFEKSEKFSWKDLYDEIIDTIKYLENHEVDIYVKDLKCEHEFFCQAEQELRKKLSGEKLEHFHTGRKLIRSLHTINKKHVKTCKPFEDERYVIHLRTFMDHFKRCVQKEFGKTPK